MPISDKSPEKYVSPCQRFNKPATTYLEQVEKLKKRGLIINHNEYAEKILSVVGYYHLTPYWIPFYQSPEEQEFKENIYFEQIIELYFFDKQLRTILFGAISLFEVYFKTTFANYLSCKYDDPFVLLNCNIFRDQNYYYSSVDKLTKNFNESKEKFAVHFKRKYIEKLPPIWVSVELMTLGEISKWFSNLASDEDKNSIAKEFDLTGADLVSLLNTVSEIRNICAHNGRLWNKSLTKPLKKQGKKSLLSSNFNNQSTDFNNKYYSRLYNPITLLLLSINTFQNSGYEYAGKIRDLILEKDIPIKEMGFPEDWLQKEIWKQKK